MRKLSLTLIFCFVFFCSVGQAGLFDQIKEGIGLSSKESPDENTIISGLKEALYIGTQNSVKAVSETDGYFGNEMIKILMPEKIQKVANVLGKLGYQQEVNDFILSMNRAAEKAGPKAAPIFVDAVKAMTFEDARSILGGSETAATDYFERKTSDKIYDALKPIIASSMNEAGVTRSYKAMMDKYTSMPFMSAESLNIDHYVTKKAMDGLFYMVGQEEKKIRDNPAARVTDLLKKVFGR